MSVYVSEGCVCVCVCVCAYVSVCLCVSVCVYVSVSVRGRTLGHVPLVTHGGFPTFGRVLTSWKASFGAASDVLGGHLMIFSFLNHFISRIPLLVGHRTTGLILVVFDDLVRLGPF